MTSDWTIFGTAQALDAAKAHRTKICRDLKQGLIEGAVLHGYDGAGEDGLIGYCHHLAERHPKAYCGLLAKLLPFNMNANVATAAINEVRIVSVPSDHYVTGAVDVFGRADGRAHPATTAAGRAGRTLCTADGTRAAVACRVGKLEP